MSDPICPKCKGNMTVGFIVDRAHYDAARVAEWSQGQVEFGFFGGVKTKSPRKVSTYCCDNCGYMESYATKAELHK